MMFVGIHVVLIKCKKRNAASVIENVLSSQQDSGILMLKYPLILRLWRVE
jgi:hypothetical protein